jgi:hypothetical protein
VRSHARHRALDAGPGLAASAITSSGGIYVQKEGKSNISDTQTAVFEYDG